MLKIDNPSALMKEIRDAEKFRDKHLTIWKKVLGRWLSCNYREDSPGPAKTLENYIHSYLALVMPQMVFSIPTASVSPEVNVDDTATAAAMEGVLNCWMKRLDYKRVLRRMARDMILGWGVTQVGYGLREARLEGASASFSQAHAAMPFCRTIPIGMHFVDAQCSGYENRRFEGHCFEIDLEDVQADARYDSEAAQQLKPNQSGRERPDDPFKEMHEHGQQRNRVTLYEVWIPEQGMIVTLGETGGNGAVYLRRERWIGPDNGPYTMWGVFEVPGQIYPFSPIAASYDQIEDLNTHASSAYQAARSYKRFGTFRKMNAEDGKAVQTVKHGQMVGLTDESSVKEMEIGGVSQQQMTVLEMCRERLDRNMGYGDAQRGMANSSTATANQLVQNNNDLRIQWLTQALVDLTASDLRKVGWYYWNMPEIVMSITLTDRVSGKSVSGEFYGGQFDAGMLQKVAGGAFAGQIGSDWVDYHLEISPESMVRVIDPIRQKRADDEWQLTMSMAQLFMSAYGPQALGAFNWRRLLDRRGEAYNEKKYSGLILTQMADQLISPDPFAMPPGMMPEQAMLMAKMGGMPQAQQQMPQQFQPPQPGMTAQNMQGPQPPQPPSPPQIGRPSQATQYPQLLAGAQQGVR